MSHMKIATKILEVMLDLADGKDFDKLNDILTKHKLITRTKYELVDKEERVTPQGIVWRFITVSCELTLIDTESDETIVNVALDSVMDKTDRATAKAQERARRSAWTAVLNSISTRIASEIVPEPEPEIIVETPESKLIAEIKALWKWGEAELEPYFVKRRGKPLRELNLPELTVEKQDLESYIRGNR